MEEDYVNLEKVLMGCNKSGAKYLQHDVYYTAGEDEDRKILLAKKYTGIDAVVDRRLHELVEARRLYATKQDFREKYQGKRCKVCDHVVTIGDKKCWSCGDSL